jgi:putative tricarboxylic transport membrane protein
MHNLALGFGVASSLQNVAFAFLGALLGTLIGVLPGLGLVTTIAMLLPSVYSLDATPALIMLAGLCGGAQYAGSITSVLINKLGRSRPAIACIEGGPLARMGRAGPALAAAGVGSFFAGCVGTVVIAAFARPLTELAFKFGPAEYFCLMVLGLIGSVVLASGSLIKGIAMIVLGLLLGQVSTDPISGVPRYSFDVPELADGIGFAAVAMGCFGFGEIIGKLGLPAQRREVFAGDLRGLWPTRQDFKDALPAMLRGTALGSILGVLPGAGARLASLASYTLEKKMPARPGETGFGQGNLRGLAGPGSAGNAGAHAGFIPMLTLGIPPNAAMALLVGAMTIKGLQPGPQVMTSNPQLFWGLIASMGLGNLMLVVLNLPLIGLWARLLSVPYRLLFPAITALCSLGLYTLNNSSFEVFLGAVFAALACLFHKLGCECAPMLLGLILGPMLEDNLRRALLLSGGDWTTFATRPLSAGLLLAAAALVVFVMLPTIRKRRHEAFQDCP